jgi:hypothetical protein
MVLRVVHVIDVSDRSVARSIANISVPIGGERRSTNDSYGNLDGECIISKSRREYHRQSISTTAIAPLDITTDKRKEEVVADRIVLLEF